MHTESLARAHTYVQTRRERNRGSREKQEKPPATVILPNVDKADKTKDHFYTFY